jgi:hypothetical protein
MYDLKRDRLTKRDVEKAMLSPVSVFEKPADVLITPDLSRDEKIAILQRWVSDAVALQRATDENMSGGETPPLDEINSALSALDRPSTPRARSTKTTI